MPAPLSDLSDAAYASIREQILRGHHFRDASQAWRQAVGGRLQLIVQRAPDIGQVARLHGGPDGVAVPGQRRRLAVPIDQGGRKSLRETF